MSRKPKKPRYPVLLARRVMGNAHPVLEAFCPFCAQWHTHGAGEQPGDGDGHRVAHCAPDVPSPFHATGYVLREVAGGADTKGAKHERWTDGLITDKRGRAKATLSNVLNVLSEHAAWQGVLCWHPVHGFVEKRRLPPVRPQDGESTDGRWGPTDTTRTLLWFSSVIGFEPSRRMLEYALAVVAQRNGWTPDDGGSS